MLFSIVGSYAALHRSLRRSLSLHLRRFQSDEDGALLILGLIFFVLMLMIGGLAVDFMRFEYTRTRLQNTLDRATLAAASLDQKLDPVSVVKDYLLKANMADQLASVQVAQGLNERIVHATGVADTHPIFMHLMGIDKWDAVGASQAQQAIDNLEIVLVLDVSGSMQGQKIANLKIAANEFVDTMLSNDPRHRVSIAIVPYNAQVNIGPLLADKFNLTHRANVPNVNCVEIPSSEYASQALSLTNPMPMMAYADIAYPTNKANAYVSAVDATYALPRYTASTGSPSYSEAFCQPTTVNVVRLPSNDPTVLKSQINALQAAGHTSITLGMKWGAAMLDPSMRPVYASFIATGNMPAGLPDRPFNYDDKEAKKYIILMTDGEHVSHNRINDAFKTGPSPIWKAPDGKYSVQVLSGRPGWAGANTWYVPHLGTYQVAAWAGGGTAVQQDWSAIWANLKMNYVAWQFYARPYGTSTTAASGSKFTATVAAMQSIYAGNTDAAAVANMDASLLTTCGQAIANRVVVYGITVEAPQHGIDVIAKCAPDHNFAATRDSIRSTFQKIAANITNLRLTQ